MYITHQQGICSVNAISSTKNVFFVGSIKFLDVWGIALATNEEKSGCLFFMMYCQRKNDEPVVGTEG